MIRTRTTELEAIVAERIRRSVQAAVELTLDVFAPDDERTVRIKAMWARA